MPEKIFPRNSQPTSRRQSVCKINGEHIRPILSTFLESCSIPYPHLTYDQNLHKLVCEDAVRRGYPMEGRYSLKSFIPGGVSMAMTAYAHLPSLEARIYIALYTACAIYVDDVFQHNADYIRDFTQHFTNGEPQADRVLDVYVDLLRETPQHFPRRVASNLILTSTLNFFTSLDLESETQDTTLSSSAFNYPKFSREMSGISEAYGLFVFPSYLRVSSYIHALPDLMTFINNVNDILSFYKEELNNESVNRISLLASCSGSSKLKALRSLAIEAVDAHFRILQILAPHPEACEAYRCFSHGYIGFHAILSRYKLDELRL